MPAIARHRADQPLAEHHLGADAALVVAAAGDGEQPPPGLVDQQHLRVLNPKSSAEAVEHRAQQPLQVAAWFMRDDSRCSTHSSLALVRRRLRLRARQIGLGPASPAPAASGNRCAVMWWTASTSNTSDASSRKIPVMPVCDAIASMRAAMRSNVGPASRSAT